ncbi:MAG: hypothetical protein WBF90_36630 [Rivularia sp. (in: cyanobacteria)]|jgi:hypothetical protein
MFNLLTKKPTITELQQTISELTTVLEIYADEDNWGETAAWGNKKKNRWLGEGNGVDLAKSVLSKLNK